MKTTRRTFVAGSSALALTTAGVYRIGATAQDATVIRWWHITTNEENAALMQAAADAFVTANPGVTIEITVQENEAFKARLTTVMQSGDPPDVFQSWGGGVLYQYAEAELVRDLTDALAVDGWGESFAQSALALYGTDGRNYGVPWNTGMVGILVQQGEVRGSRSRGPAHDLGGTPDYRPDPQGRRDHPDQPWRRRQVAGPLLLGLPRDSQRRQGRLRRRLHPGGIVRRRAVRAGWRQPPGAVRAGTVPGRVPRRNLARFRPGLCQRRGGDDADGSLVPSSALDGNLEDSAAAREDLGWFPFPVVEGGAGEPNDVLGGGDGFAVGANAPDAAIEFVRYLTSVEVQTEWAAAEFRRAAGR